eukprot:c28979_g2_i7 orf=877-1278(+)
MHLKEVSRDLRRKLFGRYRRHSRSRSRSVSPRRDYDRHRHYDDHHSHGGGGHSRRFDDDNRRYDRDNRRNNRRERSASPGWHQKGIGRSWSPRRSPVREGSVERRAKIEQWNREREQQEAAANTSADWNSTQN